jgi:hypothetical protein
MESPRVEYQVIQNQNETKFSFSHFIEHFMCVSNMRTIKTVGHHENHPYNTCYKFLPTNPTSQSNMHESSRNPKPKF